ncbi:MAG: response regulator [Candidatus Acidiferrales bacterium]
MSARIFVADDHEIVREGIKSLLRSRPEWTICGEAADGTNAVKGIRETACDAVVLDISMPGMSGLEVARRISIEKPDVRILIFTMHGGKSLLKAARDAGAHGLVLKSFAARDLMRALERIINGDTFFESDAAPKEEPSPNAGEIFMRMTPALA